VRKFFLRELRRQTGAAQVGGKDVADMHPVKAPYCRVYSHGVYSTK
jgi:hypothetical protein